MRTPLWSKVQGVAPNVLFHIAPMSRYQSCSPGMKTFLICHLLQQLGAELQLHRVAELRQVAAEDHEVGRRAHRLHLLEGAHGLLDEASVQLLRIQVRVGHPGEAEALPGLRVGDVERVDQREEAVRGCAGRALQQRFVQEAAARPHRAAAGPLAVRLQRALHLAPVGFMGIHLDVLLFAESGEVAGRRGSGRCYFFFSSIASFAVSPPLTVTGVSVSPAQYCVATSV